MNHSIYLVDMQKIMPTYMPKTMQLMQTLGQKIMEV